jgi:hypothetical protein
VSQRKKSTKNTKKSIDLPSFYIKKNTKRQKNPRKSEVSHKKKEKKKKQKKKKNVPSSCTAQQPPPDRF